ncbi:MAG: hypothetical protein LBI12_01000 [Treponema sp.]|jgi:hypothetical protein|nr:hypothetical protein [Treponema sp.]
MVQVIRDIGLSPEQEEHERHMAIDQRCEKLTLEESANWRPAGGITWEEREQQMNIKLREEGNILLSSSGSIGRPGTLELSLDTFHWFTNFLTGTDTIAKYPVDKKMYEAKRDSYCNVTLTEIRKGGFVNDIAFLAAEIPIVLEQLQIKRLETSST